MFGSRITFPLRNKILLMLLFIIIGVILLITFVMAKSFHTDKTTYIRDLASLRALEVAESVDLHLTQYRQNLTFFAEVVHGTDVNISEKEAISESLFNSFDHFVAIRVYNPNDTPVTLYNATILNAAGIDKTQLERYLDVNRVRFERTDSDQMYVGNATVAADHPMLVLSAEYAAAGSDTQTAIGIVRISDLLALARRAAVFETFVVNRDNRLLVHRDSNRLTKPTYAEWLPNMDRYNQSGQMLSTVLQFDYQGQPMIGGLARVENTDLTAVVQLPEAAAYLTARELLRNLVLTAFVLMIVAAVLSVIFARRVTTPLEKMSHALGKVAEGDFDVAVDVQSRDEIGTLSDAFNRMVSELNDRERKIEAANAALLHSQKMAAIGQLSAGIAHEIKNPLAGIQGYAQLSMRKLDEDNPVRKYAEIIEKETKRCVQIIGNLMKFARQDEVTYVYEPLNLNTIIRETLPTVEQQLKENKVGLDMKLARDLPVIKGNADQLKQVLLNFIINAQQAMEGGPPQSRFGEQGRIEVMTEGNAAEGVVLEVSDNGPGIPEDIRNKIFDPFFTTKETGKGTGLGLSVTHGIVEDHNAKISVKSSPGQGTTFTVRFPVLEDGDAGAASG